MLLTISIKSIVNEECIYCTNVQQKMHVLRIITNDKNIESVRKGRNLFLYPYFCTVGLTTNISITFLPVLLYCLCKQRDNLIQFIFKHTHIIMSQNKINIYRYMLYANKMIICIATKSKNIVVVKQFIVGQSDPPLFILVFIWLISLFNVLSPSRISETSE